MPARFALARILPPLLALIAAACAADAPAPAPETVTVGPAGLPAGTVPVYCYRTLAGADCYHEPIPAPPNRLIGAYLPVEEDPAAEDQPE